jgi:GTP cyclohydrolase I
MVLGFILDGLKEKTMSGEKMNPNQPQFELYWRDVISREIKMYAVCNKHLLTEDTLEVLDELIEHVGTTFD